MSTFILKIIACISMVIDHSHLKFIPFSVHLIIGRLAFPLFAFLTAVGYKHTKNIHNYMKRLLLLFLISIYPEFLYIHWNKIIIPINVVFTLFMGLAAIYAYDKIEDKQLKIIAVILIAVCNYTLKAEYGAYGVLTVFLFYIFMEQYAKLALSMIILNIGYILFYRIRIPISHVPLKPQLFYQAVSLLALIPIKFYNGKKGKDIKYAFYVFYPLQFLVLYIFEVIILKIR